MKSQIRCGLLMAGTCLVAGVQVFGQAPGDVVPNRYIVRLAPGADPIAFSQGHGAAVTHVYRRVMNGYAGVIPPGLVQRIAADPNVLSIQPDRVVTLVAGKPGGGGGGGGGANQVVPAGIQRIEASPGTNPEQGSGVGVAIVDTGIDFFHTDLNPSDLQYNALTGADSSNAQDDQGHGTHVAGTVAALNNTQDVVGVAPGATLYAVKVLSADGSGSDSEVLGGLNWVLENAASAAPPIRVINMSLGRPLAPGETPVNNAMSSAIQSLVGAGITVVVAAGNDCAVDVSTQVPACVPEVIAVASTTAKPGTSATSLAAIAADTASYFTTDGQVVAISAPGEDQENILKGYRLSSVGILSTRLGGGTTRMSGTSMASPHVAGVAALLYSKKGSLIPEDVKIAIQLGAARVGQAPENGRTTCYSYDGIREGILNARGALGKVTLP